MARCVHRVPSGPAAFFDGGVRDYKRYSPALRLRATDLWVKDVTDRNPLSVSMDKLGATAVICQDLLARIQAVGGEHQVIEVYPSASADQFGITPRTADTWDQTSEFADLRAATELNEHEIDAVLAALTACCFDLSNVREPPEVFPEQEGTIVLPKSGLTTADLYEAR